jgi:hypothetical protein
VSSCNKSLKPIPGSLAGLAARLARDEACRLLRLATIIELQPAAAATTSPLASTSSRKARGRLLAKIAAAAQVQRDEHDRG